LCESICPEVFKVGDDNLAKVIGSECANANISDVAADCPVDAIKVSE